MRPIDTITKLIEEADNAAGLLSTIATTHAEHMSADQRQLIRDTVKDLRSAIADAKH